MLTVANFVYFLLIKADTSTSGLWGSVVQDVSLCLLQTMYGMGHFQRSNNFMSVDFQTSENRYC